MDPNVLSRRNLRENVRALEILETPGQVTAQLPGVGSIKFSLHEGTDSVAE